LLGLGIDEGAAPLHQCSGEMYFTSSLSKSDSVHNVIDGCFSGLLFSSFWKWGLKDVRMALWKQETMTAR
jgi:hypothetical protein